MFECLQQGSAPVGNPWPETHDLGHFAGVGSTPVTQPVTRRDGYLPNRHPWKRCFDGSVDGSSNYPYFWDMATNQYHNDEWILKLVCFLVTYNHIIKFMNNKLPYWKIWQQDRKFWLLFFPMYVLLRNCRVHIPDPWSDPAPAKIDTGVGYIPTNRPAKTKIRVAPANQPTTGFSRGCRALNHEHWKWVHG